LKKLTKDEKILDALKQIWELFVAKPAQPPSPTGLWNEFKSFIENYNTIGLEVVFISNLDSNGIQRIFKSLCRRFIFFTKF